MCFIYLGCRLTYNSWWWHRRSCYWWRYWGQGWSWWVHGADCDSIIQTLECVESGHIRRLKWWWRIQGVELAGFFQIHGDLAANGGISWPSFVLDGCRENWKVLISFDSFTFCIYACYDYSDQHAFEKYCTTCLKLEASAKLNDNLCLFDTKQKKEIKKERKTGLSMPLWLWSPKCRRLRHSVVLWRITPNYHFQNNLIKARARLFKASLA